MRMNFGVFRMLLSGRQPEKGLAAAGEWGHRLVPLYVDVNAP